MPEFQEFFQNFLQSIGNLLPGVLGALLVLIIGFFIAKAIGGLTGKLLRKTDLDNRLFRGASSSFSPEAFFSKLVYYLIMLIVLMIVLEMLGVNNVLDPIKSMVGQFFDAIPRIILAGIIGFAGYIIATIVSELVGLAATSIDSFSERMGLKNSIDLGKLLKQIVFVIVFIPILIAALDALGMRTISEPATDMLNALFLAIPKIIVAGIIIAVFYYVGKYVTGIVAELLRNLGMDNMTSRLGLTSMMGNGQSLSTLISNVLFFFLMFTGIIQAVETLELTQLSEILNNLLEITGQIFFGLVILGVGNFISTIAANAVNDSFLSSIVRYATLGLFLAIALNTMDVADEIVNLAFGLTLGSIAVAVALSFGLGGREAAGKQMEHILKKFRNEK